MPLLAETGLFHFRLIPTFETHSVYGVSFGAMSSALSIELRGRNIRPPSVHEWHRLHRPFFAGCLLRCLFCDVSISVAISNHELTRMNANSRRRPCVATQNVRYYCVTSHACRSSCFRSVVHSRVFAVNTLLHLLKVTLSHRSPGCLKLISSSRLCPVTFRSLIIFPRSRSVNPTF